MIKKIKKKFIVVTELLKNLKRRIFNLGESGQCLCRKFDDRRIGGRRKTNVAEEVAEPRDPETKAKSQTANRDIYVVIKLKKKCSNNSLELELTRIKSKDRTEYCISSIS